MSVGVAHNSSKAGLCPHGLPPAACPICSGGGGGISRNRNTRRHAGEMTWNECYAMGQRMKAAQARKENAELHQQQVHLQNLRTQLATTKFAQVFNNITNTISVQTAKVINSVTNSIKNIATNVGKFVSATITNIANTMTNLVNIAKNIAIDISDKLAAIFGEEKLAKLKNLGEFTKKSLKKLISFFGFIPESNNEEESTEEIKKEEKRISFIQQLKKKLTLIKEDENSNHDS